MDKSKLLKLLVLDEGFEQFAYNDATGKPVNLPTGKLTIGIGRNIEQKGITRQEAEYLASNDIDYFFGHLADKLVWFELLDEVRQAALLDMAFNLGIEGLLGFERTLSYLKAEQYDMAAQEILASRWVDQVTNRAYRIAGMIKTGTWPAGI